MGAETVTIILNTFKHAQRQISGIIISYCIKGASTYRTAENFRGRKLLDFSTKQFRGENLRGLIRSNYYVHVGAATKYLEKTVTDGSETAKNVNVFSLERFPLYGRIGHVLP